MSSASPPPGRAGAFHADAVAIGGIGVAESGELRTFVGSCVAVILLDHQRRAAALAHVMLPTSHDPSAPPGKCADTAVPAMLRQLAAVVGRPSACTAKLVGGAKMFSFAKGIPIGEQNVTAVEAALAAAEIPISGRDCGGDCGRRVTVTVATGVVTVETVGRGIHVV